MSSRTVTPAPPRAEVPQGPDPGDRRRWLLAAPVVAALVTLAALVAGGDAPEPSVAGLPDPGLVTGWGLPLARLLFDVAAVCVVGALVTALLLPSGDFVAVAVRALRVARWSAAAWAASAAVLVVLTVSDVLGQPAAAVLTGGRFLEYVWDLSQTRGLLLVVACGVVLAAYAGWTRTRGGVAALTAVAVGGMLPVLFAGHSAAVSDHDLATSSLMVHVVAASVWVGGLGGVLVLLRDRPRTLATVLPRYSALALVCFAAVAFSGVLNAWVRTSGELALWAGSGYGLLLLAKVAGLATLGVFGWRHRRTTVAQVTAGRPRAFARLASGEVLVMAATVGVAVALSRTSPPEGALEDVPSHGFGHPTLGDDVEPFTWAGLLTEWRPEAVWLVVVAVLYGAYVAGVRRLRLAGRSWPRRRTAAATVAVVLGLLSTSGGLATYSTATFSLQVAQFLVMFIVVPALIALSMPVSLVMACGPGTGPAPEGQPGKVPEVLRSRALAWLLDPLNTLIVTTVLVFALYATPLLEASLRSAAVHLTLNLLVLAVGTVLWWSVLGIDPVPPIRTRRYRAWVLVGFLVLLAGVAVRIYLSDVMLAGTWFVELDWDWVEVPADQRLGASLMALGAVVLGPALALIMRPDPPTPRTRPAPDGG